MNWWYRAFLLALALVCLCLYPILLLCSIGCRWLDDPPMAWSDVFAIPFMPVMVCATAAWDREVE